MTEEDTVQAGPFQLQRVPGDDSTQCTHCGHETPTRAADYEHELAAGMLLRLNGPRPFWSASLSYGGLPPQHRGRADSHYIGGLPGDDPTHAYRQLLRSLDESVGQATRDLCATRYMLAMLNPPTDPEETK
jgi:hypothetical protein